MISGFGQLLTTSGVELDEQSRQEINAGVIENTTNRKAVTRILGLLLENAELIFERFVQLDDYREGTGVVLDTSYTFGARFILSLPLTSTKQ
jgi:hypothetical protein